MDQLKIEFSKKYSISKRSLIKRIADLRRWFGWSQLKCARMALRERISNDENAIAQSGWWPDK